MRRLVRIHSDDDHPWHASRPAGQQRGAVDDTPTSSSGQTINPLLSQTTAWRRPARQTPGEPTRRWQAIHESGRPAPARDARSTTNSSRRPHTSRRFTDRSLTYMVSGCCDCRSVPVAARWPQWTGARVVTSGWMQFCHCRCRRLRLRLQAEPLHDQPHRQDYLLHANGETEHYLRAGQHSDGLERTSRPAVR